LDRVSDFEPESYRFKSY